MVCDRRPLSTQRCFAWAWSQSCQWHEPMIRRARVLQLAISFYNLEHLLCNVTAPNAHNCTSICAAHLPCFLHALRPPPTHCLIAGSFFLFFVSHTCCTAVQSSRNWFSWDKELTKLMKCLLRILNFFLMKCCSVNDWSLRFPIHASPVNKASLSKGRVQKIITLLAGLLIMLQCTLWI